MTALDFKRVSGVTPATYTATGDCGKYSIILIERGTFDVKIGRTIVEKMVKGFDNAKAAAQSYEDENTESVKPAAKTTATSRRHNATNSAARIATAAPVTVSKAVRKPKPFSDFETWSADVDNVPAKTRKETAAAFAARLKSARLKWGKARKAYNVEHGIDVTPADNAKPANSKASKPAAKTAPAPEPKELLTPEERFGAIWHEFGTPPDAMEYALAQLDNARGSRDFTVTHGRLHPHSSAALTMYHKGIERCYISERRVVRLLESGDSLPGKQTLTLEYYNAAKLPSRVDFNGAPEGESGMYSAIETARDGSLSIVESKGGYEFHTARKPGEEGDDVTLPVKLRGRK